MTVLMAEEAGNYGDYHILTIEPEPEPDQPAVDDAEGSNDDDPTILLLGMLGLCLLLVICAGFSFFIRGLEPGYSVQLTGVQGLDPSQNPAVSPAFNLTVHVNNRHHMRRVCQEESYLVIYYDESSGDANNTSIGWGKLPAFCVERWSTRDLDVSLSSQGVFLSRRLQEKMESHRQSQKMELSVEIKPTCPEESSRPCLTLCEGKYGRSLAAAPAMLCYTVCASAT
ncbi:hypothetical protein CFC21_079377 [Triticum aestivum]|uniref:Late embryogenesis abundant protein LEA-2 subgroup domain-containing protein n=4 Tax=Triticinae TaxID=1648030 RepID=A0A453EC40_AEGTS|nr:hypothetical protein CFC21_079377 [Triticum aestivum]